MADINLLPEDLKEEEARQLAKPQNGSKIESSFHIPSKSPVSSTINQSMPKLQQDIKPQPKSQPIVKKIEVKQPKKAVVQPSKQLNKKGSFPFLVKNKNKAEDKIKEDPKKTSIAEAFGVNLIPEGAHLSPLGRFVPQMIISILFALLIIALAFLGLTVFRQNTVKQQEALSAKLEISEQNFQALQVREKEITSFNNKIEILKAVFKNHVYWTNFFKELERITLPEVYYSGISIGLDGNITLPATADSFYTVARQWKVFQAEVDGGILKEFSIGAIGGSRENNQINFAAALLFKPEAYLINYEPDEFEDSVQTEKAIPQVQQPEFEEDEL